MQQNWIFYPVIGMVLLTLYISARMLVMRFRAVKQDGLNPAYFLLNRGGKPPDYLVKVTQHYENLFESPVLFYLAIVLIFVTSSADPVYLSLAWLYLTLRVIHAIIHTTYNNLLHRQRAFLFGSLVLYGMWLRLFIQLITS